MTYQLYTGHRGSGKSTELRRLRKSLEEHGFFVVYFEADEEDIDPQNVEYIDIFLACTRRFLKEMRSTNPAPIQDWLRDRWQELKDLAQEECPKVESKASLLSELGFLYAAEQDYENAVTSFKKVLNLKPDDDAAWYNRGVALYTLGRNEAALTKFCEAITSYDHALDIKPDLHKAWYNKACFYGLQEKIALALKTLQHGMTLNPKNRDLAKTDSDFDAM
jgi:tetratricopeptide (TPR) repeat protein